MPVPELQATTASVHIPRGVASYAVAAVQCRKVSCRVNNHTTHVSETDRLRIHDLSLFLAHTCASGVHEKDTALESYGLDEVRRVDDTTLLIQLHHTPLYILERSHPTDEVHVQAVVLRVKQKRESWSEASRQVLRVKAPASGMCTT